MNPSCLMSSSKLFSSSLRAGDFFTDIFGLYDPTH